MKLSIIIVNYKVEKELIACISSIIKSNPKVLFEIIVVDNDSENDLKESLGRISQVKYIKNEGNIGFGAGNNLGAKLATGKYLFFLNPDTIVEKDSLNILFNFVKNNLMSGMVAPLLLDLSGDVYPNQGSKEYDLKSAIVTSSFINKLFPNNPISKKFFHKHWTKKEIEEFDVIPGTAFIIKKSLFERVGMFDEKFFLYFEEYDLAKRVKKLGYKNYIVPRAKVTHIWGASTKKRKDIGKIFSESRYLFFKKHYGIFFASIINIISSIGRYEFMLGLILSISSFLSFFKIKELMTFIGDQGWFYLSARDLLISGEIPLVGIASSRPWLHQGPLWTYLLAPFLWAFNFNPVAGAYLTIILGILSVLGIYLVGSALFSKKVGLIASLLYATSPLAVYYTRFPYHTSPIPLFVLILIFSLHKVVQNKLTYLPLTLMALSILYSFEIATAIFGVVLILILTYKLFKKEILFKEILDRNILTLSIAALMTPLLPMILYDVGNGFPQTFKFAAWIVYRIVSLFGYNQQHVFSLNKIIIMLDFLFNNFTKLIFAQSNLISFAILAALISWIIYIVLKKRERNISFSLILLLFFTSVSIIILNQSPSDAYLPMLFPICILLIAIFLNYIMCMEKLFIPVLIFAGIIIFGNGNFMFKNNFLFDESSKLFTLDKRIEAAHKILNIAGNKDYNLKGKGPGSEYESFTMNYEYLVWWMGHGPSKNHQSLKIYISESANGIKIESLNNK